MKNAKKHASLAARLASAALFAALAAAAAPARCAGGDNAGAYPYCPGCNVILVSLDTLRADALGAYGYGRATSPNMDRLAARGLLFLNAYSQAPNTFPSHMSIFTAQYPWTHKVTTILKDTLPPETETLPMQFRKAGYRTLWSGILDDPNLAFDAGFGKGFDERMGPFWPPGKKPAALFKWLEKNRDGNFFIFFHTYLVHDPYLPDRSTLKKFMKPVPPRYMDWGDLKARVLKAAAEQAPCRGVPEKLLKAVPGLCYPRTWVNLDSIDFQFYRMVFWRDFAPDSPADVAYFRTLYDASVAEADRIIGELYGKLQDLGLAGRTLLVITSDHGEAFMEHGIVTHNQLYQEALHVPLLFVAPGAPGGQRVPNVVQSIDIAHTILEAVGLPALPRGEGRSLLPLAAASPAGWRDAPAFAGPWHGSYSVRDSSRTYLLSDTCGGTLHEAGCPAEEFYDRAADPGETRDLIAVSSAAAAGYAELLHKKLQAAEKRPEAPWKPGITEETKERIKETGYW
jgi:arylsulfatase A-like enzyme